MSSETKQPGSLSPVPFKDLQSRFLKWFLRQQNTRFNDPAFPLHSVTLNLPVITKYTVSSISRSWRRVIQTLQTPDEGHHWEHGVRGQLHRNSFSVTRTVGFSSGSYYCLEKVLILFSHSNIENCCICLLADSFSSRIFRRLKHSLQVGVSKKK